ncbi:glycosyltransferase [Senegalia sp. (in: firmicutes)]|uniref:glycosyltransferase n=1 Tax=Senegalia sp. (in: firmicutes) TaxID=1924098 RepID=UPI003F9B4244
MGFSYNNIYKKNKKTLYILSLILIYIMYFFIKNDILLIIFALFSLAPIILNKKLNKSLRIIIFITFIIRVIYTYNLYLYDIKPFPDSIKYLNILEKIVNEGTFNFRQIVEITRSLHVGYSYIMYITYTLFGGAFSLYLVNIIMYFYSVFLLNSHIRNKYNEKIANISSYIMLFSAILFIFTSDILKDCTVLFFSMLSLYFYDKVKMNKFIYLIPFSLSLGFLTITRIYAGFAFLIAFLIDMLINNKIKLNKKIILLSSSGIILFMIIFSKYIMTYISLGVRVLNKIFSNSNVILETLMGLTKIIFAPIPWNVFNNGTIYSYTAIDSTFFLIFSFSLIFLLIKIILDIEFLKSTIIYIVPIFIHAFILGTTYDGSFVRQRIAILPLLILLYTLGVFYVPNHNKKKKSKKIKIAYIITGLNTGGAERQLTRIVKNIDKEKFNQIVISMLDKGTLGEVIEKDGTKVYTLNMNTKLNKLKGLKKLFNILKKERVDVLTSFMFHATLSSRIVSRFIYVPVLISSIRSTNMGSKLREKIFKWTSFTESKIITNSNFAANEIINNKIVKKEKLIVIYNGIDTKDFFPSENIRKKMRNDYKVKDKFVYLAVGRMHKAKNYDLLINSFKIVSYNNNSVLFIVGEGRGNEDKYQKLISKLGLDKKVYLVGNKTNINDFMNMSDVFVLSSKWEGMPNALIEASSCARPCVATDVGGVREILEDKKTGFIVKNDDIDEFSKSMILLLKASKEQRKIMGNESRENIIKNFSIQKVVKSWEKLYSQEYNKSSQKKVKL